MIEFSVEFNTAFRSKNQVQYLKGNLDVAKEQEVL